MKECVIKYKDNFYLKTEVGYKKIILTTDDDIINDGVQSIDDEFLEWFCSKNGQVTLKNISYLWECKYGNN